MVRHQTGQVLGKGAPLLVPSGLMSAPQERVMLMRMAQAALMPDPHYLDSPPPGMMQLCHRESVVQFINEVRLLPPSPSG